MTVSAVGQNENSHLNTIVKYTALGTAGGYSLKYLWPVTKQENDFNDVRFRRTVINYCRKVTNKNCVAEIKQKKQISPAQDMFVKMIENENKIKKDAFLYDNLTKKVNTLGGEDSAAGKEFINIIRYVNETSKDMTRKFATAYHIMLKFKRPAVPFLVAGAGVGFLAGFAHNVMKDDFSA